MGSTISWLVTAGLAALDTRAQSLFTSRPAFEVSSIQAESFTGKAKRLTFAKLLWLMADPSSNQQQKVAAPGSIEIIRRPNLFLGRRIPCYVDWPARELPAASISQQ